MASTTQPIGLEHAFKTLRQIDPVFEKMAKKRLKDDLKPIAQEIKGKMPGSPPLSRWRPTQTSFIDSNRTLRHGGESRLPVFISASAKRRVGVIVRRQRVKGFSGRRALVALRQSDAAGQVFDLAGKKQNQFGTNLSNKWHLDPSRLMWPTVERHKDQIHQSMTRAKFDMEALINEQLRSMGYHAKSASMIASGRAPMGGRF